MQTDTIMAFQVEPGDNIQVGEVTYLVKGEPTDLDDGLLFDTIDEDDDTTQLWFAPFDVLTLITSYEDEDDWEDVPIEA